MMRVWAAVLLACGLLVAPAWAQQSLLGNTGTASGAAAADLGPPVAVPPAPPIAPAAPSAPAPVVVSPSAPGLVQTPVPPANADSGTAPPADNSQPDGTASSPAAPVPSTADSMPPPPNNDWVSDKTASLGILDMVDGSTAAVTIPVGGQSTVGDLLVNVLACDSRPAGELPDDAIFVSIQPVVQSDGGPIFRGWMLRSLPGAAVVGDASETFRVAGCS
jgi:hypothetical protein